MDNYHHQQPHLYKPIPLLFNNPTASSVAAATFNTHHYNQNNSHLIVNHHSSHQHHHHHAVINMMNAATVNQQQQSPQPVFISFAGSDISMDSKVYLLYDIPMVLLARRFNTITSNEFNKINEKLKISVCGFIY